MLYIDPRPGQPCHSKDGGSAYSIGVGELGWRCGTGLKSHGTLKDWCTGRDWPVNCMTVISARWRSNMPFQRLQKWHIPMASYEWAIELLYNSVKKGSQLVWRSETRVVEKASTQQRAGPLGLRLSNPGGREKKADGHKSGEVNMF